MPPRSAIVLVVDRLGSGWLGPYGNTWIDTPALNRLAAESLLFSHVLSDSPCLSQAYRSWWLGQHALAEASTENRSLIQVASEAGVNTCLLSDDERVVSLPLAESFQQCLSIPAPEPRSAATLDETAFAHLLAAAMDWLERNAFNEPSAPFLLWIHATAMQGPWDAPLALRNAFADAEDPAPPEFVAPPIKTFNDEDDPDELLGVMHAYAGQVAAIDAALGVFLDALEQWKIDSRALLCLTSPRGFALGEHGAVGPLDNQLTGELLNVPLLLRTPDRSNALRRVAALVQPDDLHRTLLAWFEDSSSEPPLLQLDMAADESPEWQLAAAAVDGLRAIRTPAWFLAQTTDGAASRLYAKPDDQWECNEVSDRCAAVVEELTQLLDELSATADTPRKRTAALSDALRYGQS